MAKLNELMWSGERIIPRKQTTTDTLSLYKGTRGPHLARVMVVGEAYGQKEQEKGMPFVGPSGVLLEKLLAEAGINPATCLFTNLINAKPNNNDMSHFLIKGERGKAKGVKPNVLLHDGLQKLDALINHVKPRLIIACGNWPLWHLTDRATLQTKRGYRIPKGIGAFAGSQLYTTRTPTRHHTCPVLPIFHPASILRQYHWHVITLCDLARATAFLRGGSWDRDASKETLHIMPTANQVVDFLEHLLTSETPEKPSICDIETNNARIHIFGVGRQREAMPIPFFDLKGSESIPVYNPQDFEKVFRAIVKFLSMTKGLVGQNFTYDMQYISTFFGVTPKVLRDTMITQHIIFPALRGFKGLDSLSRFYCHHHVYWKDERKESLDAEDLFRNLRYNGLDLFATSEVDWAQCQVLNANPDLKPHLDARMEEADVCIKVMLRGIPINEKLRQTQLAELRTTISNIEKWFDEVVPPHLRPQPPKSGTPWYRSNTQLSTLLFHILGLQGKWNPETENYSTEKEELARLGEKYPGLRGFFSALIIYRSARTIADGYLSVPLDFDGRMRCAYNLAGPITDRYASGKNAWGGGTNLQNTARDRDEMELTEQDLV